MSLRNRADVKSTERIDRLAKNQASEGISNIVGSESSEWKLIGRFIFLASKFWSGASKTTAWLLSFGFVGSLITLMILAIAVNRWNKYFFDAVQLRDIPALELCVLYIIGLGIGTALTTMMLMQMRMRLQLRWRQWLTSALINRWLESRQFHNHHTLRSIDNPEARIADDGRLSVEILVDLAGGIINTVLLSTSFTLVLWHVGGAITLCGWTIPGYLVIAVVLYTVVTSFSMLRLGIPLVKRVEEKSAGEGDFRYALTCARERSGVIALVDGDKTERKLLKQSFEALAESWVAVIGRQTRMVFLSSGNTVLGPAAPLLLAAPKYLAGDMTLGDLMQAAAAFWQVHAALNWLADNALSLANWSASARRVAALDLAYQELDNHAPRGRYEAVVHVENRSMKLGDCMAKRANERAATSKRSS
jgi:putative ATP-binding cassette transporter